MKKYKLRPYQEKAVEAGLRLLNNKKKADAGLIVAPTGSGKSLIIGATTDRLKGNTLILQPTKEILEQNLEKLNSYGYNKIGIFSASLGQKNIEKITLGTIGTIVNNLEAFKLFDNILVDEAHNVNSKDEKNSGMYNRLFDYLQNIKIIGYTATPFRNSSDSVGTVAKILTRTRPRVFKNILYAININELYKNNFLCPLEYDIKEYDDSKLRLNSTKANYKDDSLQKANTANEIIDKVIDKVKENIPNRNIFLIFNSFVKEAEETVNKLNQEGIKSAIISAKTPKLEREQILKEYKQGNIKAVCNVGTLTTGFDCPEIDCIILARKTMSLSLFLQMIGRGVRIAFGKTNCLIIDLVGNVKQFGKFETMKLVRKSKKHDYVWKSEKGYLTGVYIHSLKDVSEYWKNIRTNTIEDPTKLVRMPFGKFKGVAINLIPLWYIEWLIKGKKGTMKEIAINEKKRRTI